MEKLNEHDLKATIFFYFREKCYNLMANACKEGISRFKSDVSFKLYQALSCLLNNRIEECINDMDAIKGENDVRLAVTIGLLYAHKMLGVNNKELFAKMDGQMRELRKITTAVDFYHSGFVLFALNKCEKAVDYLDKSISTTPTPEALALRGWVMLEMRKRGKKPINVTDLFEVSLKDNVRNLDGTLGLIESCLFQNKLADALTAANKAIVRFTLSGLPLVAKMRVLLAQRDWDQVVETMNRIIDQNVDSLDALKVNIVVLLCRDANYEKAVACLRKFANKLETKEPKNTKILLENAQLFSKICDGNHNVLLETYAMVEKAVQLYPENLEYIVELGYQCLLQARVKEALKYFKMANKIDSASFITLLGITMCELADTGATEQIRKQVEYLMEFEEAQTSPQLQLLCAKLCKNQEEALDLLRNVVEIQLGKIKGYPYSASYLLMLDPHFMFNVVKEYLQYVTSKSELHKNVSVQRSFSVLLQELLTILARSCPGIHSAIYLSAKFQHFNGETANAVKNLEQIIQKSDDSSGEAHMMLAKIHVDSGFHDRAAEALENALSRNFKILENSSFHYIKGLVDQNRGHPENAVDSFRTALKLSSSITPPKALNDYENDHLRLSERVSVYIKLIEMYYATGQVDEGARMVEEAVEEFQNTPEETRILIFSAENEVKRNNIQAAIDLLSKVPPGKPYSLQARTMLADILLKFRRDKQTYLKCYEDLVAENPGPESYILLGDAYMNILEPDEALDAYNKAYQQNPKDSYLTWKMGKALVDTHYFLKAVNFYKEAISSTNDSKLKLELGNLYIQLKKFDEAEVLLRHEIESEASNLDLTTLQMKTKFLILLSQAIEKSGNMVGAFSALKEAKDVQIRVKKRFLVEHSEVPPDEIKILIDMGVKLAEMSVVLKNNDQAIKYYREALEVAPNDINVMAALAKLYMQLNFMEPCQQLCSTILKNDPENEAASVMMADIAFRKIDFDMALFHFTQLIVKQPTNWTALVRLIEIMRRTGTIEEAAEFLKNAENLVDNTSKEPGLLFCTALLQWHTGVINGALRNFNAARSDPEWGLQSLYNMIEICLNPNGENILSEQFMNSEDVEYKDSRSMALKTAERLLKELKQRLQAKGEDMLQYRLLVNFRLLATQEKYNIEQALEDFISIASQSAYKEHVGPILGMSTAYTMLKQSQRAKNQLKRVAKTIWTFEDAEYLERCWLLLADYYIQSAKYEAASELLNRVVQHNKACFKAFDYLGYIAEKEQKYKEAAQFYYDAWRHGGKSHGDIGYKLAHSYIKLKKYSAAIDVGQEVLKLNPDYPRIKKDILDKAMNNLRM